MSGAISAGTLAAVAGIGAAGSIGGALIGSSASKSAANTQAQAAQNAAQLQYQASQNALDFQKQEFNTEQQNLAPWLQAGQGSLSNLQQLLGSASNPGSLMQSYPGGQFTAPTESQMIAGDPGYQARMDLGEQALQQSAAARGNLLTGGTAQALDKFGQDYASNEYQNYYNQALNTYGTNYNVWNQGQTNQYNRLASMAGVGQQTATQLGQLGQSAANGISNNLLGTAANMGQQYNNAAAANASGMIGSANAWSGALGGTANSLSNLMLMQNMLGGQSNGYTGALFPSGNELGG